MAAKHPETELAPFLRGELGAAERAKVAAHLEICLACRDEASAFERVMAAVLANAPRPPAVDWRRYRAELRGRLDERLERRSVRAWRRLVPFTAGALALSALFLVLGRSPHHSPAGDDLSVSENLIGSQLELIENYPVLENLDLLEDLDVVQNLDGLTATAG